MANGIEEDAQLIHWRDWKWQLKHAIRDVDTFERLLGIEFAAEERRKIEDTIAKFPMSITPSV